MPYPEIYTYVLFAAVIIVCTATAAVSVTFYNTLHRKELLSDTRPSVRASSPLFYIICALFGLAFGIVFAFRDITFASAALIVMMPAAAAVAICDILNGFIPVIGLILMSVCAVIRCVAVCVSEGALWPLLAAAAGGLFGLAFMLLVNLISKKTGAAPADKGHIALVTVICASAGIVPGTAILATAEITALLAYILPVYIRNRKNGEGEKLSQISYPLAPFIIAFYYIAAMAGMF